MLFNLCKDRPGSRRAIPGLVALTLLPFPLLAGPALGGDCARIMLLSEDFAVPAGSSEVEVLTVELDGNDLSARIEVSQGFNGNVLWIDETGTALQEPLWVDPGAGPVDVVFAGAVDLTSWPGFQYRLQMKALGVKKPILDLPVRLQPICSPNGPCDLVALPDVESSVPMIGPQLASALRQARQAGASDVLDYAKQHDPSLGPEILAFAWQLGSYGAPTATGCHCSWLTEVSASPSAAWGNVSSPGPTHAHGAWYGGVYGVSAGQTLHGRVQSPHSGFLSTSMELACRRKTGESLEVLSLGGRTLLVEVPIYEPCSKSCEPEVRHDMSTYTCVDAKAYGIGGMRADAEVGVGIVYEIDGQHVSSNLNSRVVTSSDPDGAFASGARSEPSLRTVAAHRSTSRLDMASHLILDASKPQDGAPGSYAFGVLSSKFYMDTLGTATCEDQVPVGRLYLGGGANNDGGVMLVIWGDPPS